MRNSPNSHFIKNKSDVEMETGNSKDVYDVRNRLQSNPRRSEAEDVI
jgi:hypothetical protein